MYFKKLRQKGQPKTVEQKPKETHVNYGKTYGTRSNRMKYLKIKTLEKGWHDKDEILLHAAFQLLADFIEQEKPDKIVDWSWNEEHRKAWKEITSLYKWWKRTRPARKSPLDDRRLRKPPLKFVKIPGSDYRQMVQPDRKKYAGYYRALKKESRLEQKWHEEDQRNLHRLIEIRGFLWT